MIDRIKQIMSLEQLSASQFADEINLQRSSLSHVMSGRNKPSLDFVMKIKKSFNRISLDWLIFGDGPMFDDEDRKDNSIELQVDSKDTMDSKPDLFNFQAESISQENKSSNPEIPEISGQRVKMVNDEQPEYYGKKTNRIVIFYSNGTYEEFTKA